jgi:hypothetical protein
VVLQRYWSGDERSRSTRRGVGRLARPRRSWNWLDEQGRTHDAVGGFDRRFFDQQCKASSINLALEFTVK